MHNCLNEVEGILIGYKQEAMAVIFVTNNAINAHREAEI